MLEEVVERGCQRIKNRKQKSFMSIIETSEMFCSGSDSFSYVVYIIVLCVVCLFVGSEKKCSDITRKREMFHQTGQR